MATKSASKWVGDWYGSGFRPCDRVGYIPKLTLKDGERIRLRLRTGFTLGTVNADVAADWLDRCVRWARSSSEGIDAVSFERNGRSLAEWRRSLRAMFRAGYRSVGATPAAAVDVVRDARNAVSARLGAAIALVDGDSPDRSDALSVAVETCANPRLRVALEQAARGRLDERLLAEVEEEAQLPRASERAMMGAWQRRDPSRG